VTSEKWLRASVPAGSTSAGNSRTRLGGNPVTGAARPFKPDAGLASPRLIARDGASARGFDLLVRPTTVAAMDRWGRAPEIPDRASRKNPVVVPKTRPRRSIPAGVVEPRGGECPLDRRRDAAEKNSARPGIRIDPPPPGDRPPAYRQHRRTRTPTPQCRSRSRTTSTPGRGRRRIVQLYLIQPLITYFNRKTSDNCRTPSRHARTGPSPDCSGRGLHGLCPGRYDETEDQPVDGLLLNGLK